jgi:eukaryotic-like serine/threonine-protein kinase
MSGPKRCEQCGAPLSQGGVLGGRCPRCMVELGFESVIGRELSHYRIESHLGSGGMGEVYQARDAWLDRRVAIKILPDVFAQDEERVARFEREAKVLASLNHANIATLYGLEQSDGRHFLVMELVEGETLADRIQRGPVPVEETLTIAHQITQAFEAAHEASVVHRDLKPANVKITPAGKVKVLDFGLAKALEAAPGSTAAAPTLSTPPKNAGVIMGTPAYMSPEQAKGFAADPRSDIFAFGCVLYEMLSGRKPFRGETLTDVIASVLAREPDLALLPPNLHPRISELIRRFLVKEARNRWQAVADVRLEIESILPDPHGATVRRAERGPWWRRAIPVVVTASLAVAITWGIAWNRRQAPAGSIVRFSIALPEGQQVTRGHNIALSPDGQNIVYVANGQLYLRAIAEVEARPIPGTAQQHVDTPFFSPDGRWIGFMDQC